MITLRTETWNTRKGEVVKAVARDAKGHLLGATNQTASVTLTLVGKK